VAPADRLGAELPLVGGPQRRRDRRTAVQRGVAGDGAKIPATVKVAANSSARRSSSSATWWA
jgi:hypothetical protein